VDAPPAPFLLATPAGWRRGRVELSWEPAPDAFGPVTYTVLAGGRRLARTSARRVRLGKKELGDGRHSVRVVASDGAGQSVETTQPLLVDRRAPRVRMRRSGRRVRVAVRDGKRRVTSGPARRSLRIAWGDGSRSRGRTAKASHRYAEPGRYRVVVRARDRAGNRVVSRRRVTVR
jgi:PKD domain